MKQKLTNNLSLKLLAILGAFLVWLGVVNVANPLVVRTQEVPVAIVNADVLEKSQLSYEVIGKSTATVAYRVKTKDDYRVTADDFYAYADLSEMYDVTGAIPIHVEVVSHSNLIQNTPTVRAPEVIRIKTEPLQSKTFEVQAYTGGTAPASGYVVGGIQLTPSAVTVKGPQSLVGQISSVGISIDVSGASQDLSGTLEADYYDANGNVLSASMDSVVMDNNEITYAVDILQNKEVPLNFVAAGNVAAGYRYTGTEAAVSAVTIAGTADQLKEITELRIQNPALDVDGATEDKTVEVDLADFLPEGVTITGLDSTKLSVTMKVEQLFTRTLRITSSRVNLTGEDENYDYSISIADPELQVQGLRSVLNTLSASGLQLTADVSGMGEGPHVVRVSADLDPGIDVLKQASINVNIISRSAGQTAVSSSAEDGSVPESSRASETSAAESGT